MEAKILFQQTYGSVDEETSSDPNGVEVILSLWTEEVDWRLPNHYLLKKIVMVDRHYEMDEVEVHINSIFSNAPANEIRNAIRVFDTLVKQLIDLYALVDELNQSKGMSQ